MSISRRPMLKLSHPSVPHSTRVLEVLLVFLRLGCTCFGGPIAHLAYFEAELVQRRQWCSPAAFAEVVALAQSLPGPASSQTGFALGILRAGWLGGIAAWAGFTLPSAGLMFALALMRFSNPSPGLLRLSHALQLVAVAVVAQAVLAMRRSLAPDRSRFTIAFAAAAIVLLLAQNWASLLAIAAAALCGLLIFRSQPTEPDAAPLWNLPKPAAIAAAVFFFLPLALPTLWRAQDTAPSPLAVFAAFYRAGALVFGGGHVVLPMLQSTVVAPGWLPQPTFLAGYGAAQALPGPLFTLAAFLGAGIPAQANPLRAAAYAASALLGIFLPGLLAVVATLPFWAAARRNRYLRAALTAINAAVLGILIAALFEPLWTSTVHSAADFLTALAAFALLTLWKRPSWQVVALFALLSQALTL